MQPLLLHTDNADETEDLLSRLYTRVRVNRQGRSRARVHIARSELGALSIDSARVGSVFEFEAEAPPKVFVCRVHRGVIEQRPAAQPARVFAAGSVAAFGVDAAPFSGAVQNVNCDVVAAERTLFDRVAAWGSDGGIGPVRLTDSRPVSTAAARQLCMSIDYLRQLVPADSHADVPPLLADGAAQLFGAAVLAAFPFFALSDPTAMERRDTTPMLMRRALSFIDENAHTAVGLAEISDAVGVSPRAVQYMFRKHRGCTPTEYMRRVRLEYAHRELVAGDRETTTVAQVARRWGFGHIGRFAVSYRELYGCSPHVTLRG